MNQQAGLRADSRQPFHNRLSKGLPVTRPQCGVVNRMTPAKEQRTANLVRKIKTTRSFGLIVGAALAFIICMSQRGEHPFFGGRSVDWRQADFGEQLLEGRITVKAGENLVTEKIQHEFVVRLDADCQVLERCARIAEPSLGLRHKIG
jgi:hypothetical protein